MPLATRLRYKHFVGNSGRESGLEKETQDGLICPSCANLVIVSPVFGFILTAKGYCCPGRFLEGTYSSSRNNVLVQALPHKTRQEKGNLWEK